MNPLRGINQDISPNELPDGFYPFAKNVLLSSTFEAIENEKGFLDSTINSNGSYKELYDLGLRPIGVISTTKFEVFWLTNNTRSVVGTYNQDLDTFTIVYDDNIQPKLNLNLLYPLKAVWRENFLGEIYVAWTDRLNKPKILNLQKASLINSEKDILLFSEFIQPTIETTIQNSGGLLSGTYYGYVQYTTNDGKSTDYSLASFPIYITPDPTTNPVANYFGSSSVVTSKSILFHITNVDTSYDKLTLAVQKINSGNNIKSFVQVTTINIVNNNTIDIVYTGGETTNTLTPDDVLIKAPSYSKVHTITTLNSQLLLGNLESNQEINIQKYVNNWKIKWLVSEINNTNYNLVPKYSTSKSFAHDEVYALYAVILFKSGKLSQAFTIPGRDVSTVTVGSKVFNENAIIKAVDNLPTEVGYSGDTDFLTEDFSLNTGNVKYFQTRDTCSWDGSSGIMSYWENETEVYLNTDDYDVYDSTGKIGTIKNTKVRHHKFPSNSFIKDTIYSADDQYGVTKIDRLGIKLEDVYLPDEILSQVDKILVCHAKRNFNNSLVVAQDKTSFMGCILNQVDQDPEDGQYNDFVYTADQWGTLPVLTSLNHYFNFDGDAHIRGFTPYNNATFPLTFGTFPDYYRLKLHSPEILNSQPSLGNSYLKLNFKVIKEGSTVWKGLGGTNTSSEYALITLSNLSGGSGASSVVGNDKKIIKVNAFNYVIENQVNYPSGTNLHTDCLNYSENGGIIDINNKFDFSGTGDNLSVQEMNITPTVSLGPPPHLETPSTIYDYYYHFNINKFNTNVYNSYLQQDLIVTESFSYGERGSKTIYNADVFLDLYSFNCFGGFPPNGADNGQMIVDASVYSIRTNHVHFIETSINSGMRYTSYLGNTFNRGNANYLDDSAVLNSGNHVSVNPDYNQINEEVSSTIFENSSLITGSFPHRIVKSLPITSESKVQQWTQFLPLDYYEIDKSKGVIINLQGVVDRLLIHTERALFVTRDKARLGTDIGQVNLTSGDLFDFAPQEVLPTNNGFTGTQHMFSCALLNEGYFWVDAQSGRVFLYDMESLKEISNIGLYNFFANNLGTFEDSPFNSNGITVTNDLRYNRLLVSIKNGTNNFTLSFLSDLNQGKGGWVSFHDYDADYLFSSRKNTFSFKNGKLYKHNYPSLRGTFYDGKFSSFIDVTMNSQSVVSSNNGKRVFNDSSIYLNSVEWNTDFSDIDNVYNAEKTISHLTVRNQYQHSSKIPLNYSELSITSETNSRNAEFKWHCNTFRDLVANKRLPFIQDIFNNFDEVSSNIDINKPWFEQEQFNNKWFVIRLEYDNEDDYKMVLHSIDINKSDSYR